MPGGSEEGGKSDALTIEVVGNVMFRSQTRLKD